MNLAQMLNRPQINREESLGWKNQLSQSTEPCWNFHPTSAKGTRAKMEGLGDFIIKIKEV